jgi:hypothetical protein
MNGTGTVDFKEGTGRNREKSINKNILIMGCSTRTK